MERALEELKTRQRENAAEAQDEAVAELLKAKEKLEEILRQLREEERELMLAALEARFRDLLSRQLNVYNATVGLDTVPTDQRSDRHRNRAVELARQEDEIVLLTAKVLTLLKEEGSSIAFPEAVEQLRGDMQTIARRLERVELGELTQAMEQDVIESLEEVLESLQKELEQSKDRQQGGPQQQGQPQDQALVDQLSELKMLRSLQYRINRRTLQLGRLVDGEQSADPEVRLQLQVLAGRQAKIQRTAEDLAAGRNR
jgi:beta-glucosidase-like glycosyl hydrolase